MKIFCDKKPTKTEKCMFSYYEPVVDKYMCKLLSEDGEVCDLEDGLVCSCLEELVVDPKHEVHLDQVELYGKIRDNWRRKHSPGTLSRQKPPIL